MPRVPIDSSAITNAKYDAALRHLDLDFPTGKRYRYFDVPPTIYAGLLAAESKGRYYNDHIRDVYLYERLN